MARLSLKKKKNNDPKPEKVSRPADVDDDDEDFSDDDFFAVGEASAWAERNVPRKSIYRPDFWPSDDEKRNKIIFTSKEPAYTLLVHSLVTGMRNGKPTIDTVTCCSAIRPCKLCQVAAKDSAIGTKYSVYMWELKQLRKWEDKEGNTHWVSNRYWRLPVSKSNVLSKTLSKYDIEDTLFEVIKGSRGAHQIVGSPMTEKWRDRIEQGPENFTKEEFIKLYKPMSDAEAEGRIKDLLGTKSSDDMDDDDDD